MTSAAPLASAIKELASAQKTTFATTQAVWRFLNNDSVSFSQLNQPLIEQAMSGLTQSVHPYALVIHDWSHLQFFSHNNKSHRIKMTHSLDPGYELQSSLLVDASSGLPVAPVGQSLSDEQGYRSTFDDKLHSYQPHLDALTTNIAHIEALNFDKKLVHIIDREGDSIAHLRKLSIQNVNWLIRGKEGHLVDHEGISQKLGQVADRLTNPVNRPIAYKGKTASLSVS
jgi:hypothetical protein